MEKALELDSTLAEAQFVVAGLRTWSDWDWEGAETAFRRVIEPAYRLVSFELVSASTTSDTDADS